MTEHLNDAYLLTEYGLGYYEQGKASIGFMFLIFAGRKLREQVEVDWVEQLTDREAEWPSASGD